MLAEKISRTKLAKSMMPAEGTIRSPCVRGDFGRSRAKGVCDSVGHKDVHEKRHRAAKNYLLRENADANRIAAVHNIYDFGKRYRHWRQERNWAGGSI